MSRRSQIWLFLFVFAGVAAALLAGWRVWEARDSTGTRDQPSASSADSGGPEPDGTDTAPNADPDQQQGAETVIDLTFGDATVAITATELRVAFGEQPTAASLFDLFAGRSDTAATSGELAVIASVVDPYTDASTPRIRLIDGALVPVLSTDVPVPDLDLLTRRVQAAVQQNPGGRVAVEVPVLGTEPVEVFAIELATALASHANEITAGGVMVQLEGTTETLHFAELALRQFMVLQGERHEAQLTVDPRVADTLASLFVGIGEKGTPATFSLDDSGAVTITESRAGFKCCGDSAVDALVAGIVANEGVITLPTTPDRDPRGLDWAESLGISELVGEFTTPFKPAQDRIINIARISELTRGAIIEPGARFSVNDFVGPRTTVNGFVPAGMILEGVFVDSVGGGISQYATTLFNAAFFAGLDFIAYQAHSIYLSRYPYGREATVSYPAPDLVLENNTPYGVMLWPTTGADSITVKLYSTPWVTGEQTNQWTYPRGTSCTLVVTERTRTWLEDGRTDTDRVSALYRPEGLRCDGTPSVPTTVPPDAEADDPQPQPDTDTDTGDEQPQPDTATDTGDELPANDNTDTGDQPAGGNDDDTDDQPADDMTDDGEQTPADDTGTGESPDNGEIAR